MKQKILFYLFLLIGMISLNASCDKDDPANPIDQLPPLTNTGANRAGCLVNGQALLPTGGGSVPNLVCNYQEIDGEKYFRLTFSDQSNTSEIKNIIVFVRRINIIQGQSYILENDYILQNIIGGGAVYNTVINASINDWKTNSQYKGELKITYLNEAQQIISGTFWFDAVNEQGEVVQVREGRFDVTYSL